jgi:hypothetical protein
LALITAESSDLKLMAAADAEICRRWRYYRFGVYREKEFARVNARLECRPVFNHIQKHPTLAL